MKKLIAIAAIFALTLGTQEVATAQTNNKTETKTNSDKQAIEKVIATYQDALNASDASKVVGLFTKTGVLMANAAPTAEGSEAVKGTYQYVFDNFTYDLKFTVLDVVVNGNTAYVRSQSKG